MIKFKKSHDDDAGRIFFALLVVVFPSLSLSSLLSSFFEKRTHEHTTGSTVQHIILCIAHLCTDELSLFSLYCSESLCIYCRKSFSQRQKLAEIIICFNAPKERNI
jgi:hypothetical protein